MERQYTKQEGTLISFLNLRRQSMNQTPTETRLTDWGLTALSSQYSYIVPLLRWEATFCPQFPIWVATAFYTTVPPSTSSNALQK